jgi:hypothetical protein
MSIVTTLSLALGIIGSITVLGLMWNIMKSITVLSFAGGSGHSNEKESALKGYIHNYTPHFGIFLLLTILEAGGILLSSSIYVVIPMLLASIAMAPALRSPESKFNNRYTKIVDGLLLYDGKLQLYCLLAIYNFYMYTLVDVVSLFY